VLALDADAAGKEAALRGHDAVREALAPGDAEGPALSAAEGPALSDAEGAAEGAVPVVDWRGLVGYQSSVAVQLHIAVLPEGRDPDEVIRADPGLWRQLIEGAKPVLDYRLEAAAAARNLSDPHERSRLVQDYLPLLAEVTDPVLRAHYIQRLSRLAQVSEKDLSVMARRAWQRRRARPQSAGLALSAAEGPVLSAAEGPALSAIKGSAPAARQTDPREEFLLALLLQRPELREAGLDFPEDLLWESENRQILAAWKNCAKLGPPAAAGTEAVKEALPVELHAHLERLSQRRLPAFGLKEALEALADCRRRLERRQMEAEKQALAALLADRQEEFGPVALIEAMETAPEDEQTKEVVSLQMRDLEAGLKLHSRERSSGGSTAGTRTND